MTYNHIILFLLLPLYGLTQVGIGTTTPTETLEVNGTMKVNNLSPSSVSTTQIMGVDNQGVFHIITIGDNLTLNNNVLDAEFGIGGGSGDDDDDDFSFGEIVLEANEEHHNVDLLIGNNPVTDVNREHEVIRISSTDGDDDDIEITGFVAGFDGQNVWLYAQNGDVKLKDNEVDTSIINPDGSLPANKIEKNGKMKIDQWELMRIVYDGQLEKWVIMHHD